MRDEGTIPIRSYRVCFEMERRIHRIDNWRVPLSYGLPLVGLGWAMLALAIMAVASSLPILGPPLGLLHPALRFVLVPIAVAWLLCRWRIDGRSPAATALAYVRWRTGPRRLVAFRAAPEPGPRPVTLGTITFAADERGARLRPGVVQGPARVVLRYPARLRERGRTLHVTAQDGPPLWRGTEVRLMADQRLVVAR
jgi:hypothetical protein